MESTPDSQDRYSQSQRPSDKQVHINHAWDDVILELWNDPDLRAVATGLQPVVDNEYLSVLVGSRLAEVQHQTVVDEAIAQNGQINESHPARRRLVEAHMMQKWVESGKNGPAPYDNPYQT